MKSTPSQPPPNKPQPWGAWILPAALVAAAAAFVAIALHRYQANSQGPAAPPPPPREAPAPLPPPPTDPAALPAPAAPAQPPATAPAPDASSQSKPALPPAPTFRVSGMLQSATRGESVGIVDRQTGGNYQSLRLGETSPDGWMLVSMNFDNESAVFEKDGQRHAARIETGVGAPSPASTADAPPAAADLREEAVVQPPERQKPSRADRAQTPPQPPPPPFSNRSFRIESGAEVAVSALDHAPAVVEVRTGAERFALRRTIADSILAIENVSPDDRLRMMASFPAAVAVYPGEDAGELSAEAERLLAEMLTPPTNRVPVEELPELIDRFIETNPYEEE
jgi:hypothetical protein